MKYNDEEYRAVVGVYIGDIFYSNASYNSKIADIRKYAEVIVRRLIHRDTEKPFTLGNQHTKEKLRKSGIEEEMFWNAVEKINSVGSDRTHTQVTTVATKREFDDVVDSLFDLYAYLFVYFFKRFRFGQNQAIVTSFSILPPIIRYKALNELYLQDPENTIVIDKLTLSILKAFSADKAKEWIDKHKSSLEQMHSNDDFSSDMFKNLIAEHDIVFANTVMSYVAQQRSKTVYDICMDNVLKLSQSNWSPLYNSFETALTYYKNNGVVSGDSKEVEEFNALMSFVYMGRKEDADALKKEQEQSFIIDQI